MNCHRARRLLAATAARHPGLRRHLAACAECSRYGERLESVFTALGEHHLAVSPPTTFATRVRARLQRDDDSLAWAALRLLPATLGLLLLLSWLNYRSEHVEAAVSADPTTAVLSWVLDSDGAQGGGS